MFCVSSSLSLVQSNVNTEKDDNSSDDKDIDCTNNESEFSTALYELFHPIEFIIWFLSTLVSHGPSIYILFQIWWNIQTLWCLRNESYMTWLYIVYRRYWWSGKSLDVHIEFNNISSALFILFYPVPMVRKMGTNFWWRDIDFRLLNCILNMYIPSISSNLGFKVHDL